jgi:hypothetical protein
MSNDDKGGRNSFGKRSADQWEEKGEQNLLRHGKDDGDKAARDISCSDLRRTMDDPGDSPYWKTGALPRGGKPRYAPTGDSGTKQVSAYSPSGKYGKVGGKGQRSGA